MELGAGLWVLAEVPFHLADYFSYFSVGNHSHHPVLPVHHAGGGAVLALVAVEPDQQISVAVQFPHATVPKQAVPTETVSAVDYVCHVLSVLVRERVHAFLAA